MLSSSRQARLVSFQRDQQVDLVLCSGDYTALGLRSEYERALRCVRPLMNTSEGYINVPGKLPAGYPWNMERYELDTTAAVILNITM